MRKSAGEALHCTALRDSPDNENNAKYLASMALYFFCHDVPHDHVKRILRNGFKKPSNDRNVGITQLGDFAKALHQDVITTVRIGMQSFIAMYTFEVRVELSE